MAIRRQKTASGTVAVAGPIFGRSTELALISTLLDEMGHGPMGLAMDGRLGAGKTTLWQAAVVMARERGYRVLEAHPAEAEEALPFAALGDLFDGLVDDPDLELPAPQHHALRVAMLLDEPESGAPDQRSVSVAALSAFRSLASRSPLLIAVDDLQWMDRPSARVLEFVVRRLRDERIGVIAASRSDEATAVSDLFDQGFAGRDAQHLSVGPLSIDALDAMLGARLGATLPRPFLAKVEEAAGGNPLFAVEIARGIQRGEIEPRAGELLLVPRTLQQYAKERISRLPADVREVLAVAAAVAEPTMAVLEAATSTEALAHGVELAASDGIVEIRGERLEFSHPLFASTLYHAVPVTRRRDLHRKLATIVAGPDERARHLALSTDGPDSDVAQAVEDAARRASARGAPDAAAALAERAHELTPPDDAAERERRRLAAGEYHFASGNLASARQIFEEMVTLLSPGPIRAAVLRRLAKVRYRTDSCAVAAQLLTRALAEAGDDPSLRARLERDLSWAVMLCGDMEAAATHAEAAHRLTGSDPESGMFAEVLAATAMAAFLQGDGLPLESIQRAVALEHEGSETPIEWRPSMMLGMMLNWSGDSAEARRRFDVIHHQTVEAGDDASLPFLLQQMSESATFDGDWAAGLRLAEDAITASRHTGQEVMRAAALYARALAEAHGGELDGARATAQAGLELAHAVGSVVIMIWNQGVLGFIEISAENPAAAHAHLAPLVAWRDVVGIREPGMLRFLPDEIEALIGLGHLDSAGVLLDEFQSAADRLERSWAQLAAARCRALHAAAGGAASGSVTSLRTSLDNYGAQVHPFERARALLVLGSIQRRTRRRKDANTSIEAAQEIFERLGAPAWAARARRLGPARRGVTSRSGGQDLTPAELRVAQAVARGATNRETAAQLFVSVRTVELHLTSVYRKLGIRSRSELAAKMASEHLPA